MPCEVRCARKGALLRRIAFVPACKKALKHALVVGDRVCTLSTLDQASLDELNKLAWQQAKVTGKANGDTISVKSVAAK